MKTALRTLTIPLMALSLAACGLSPEERFDRAEQSFADHRFSEAKLDLASILKDDADNVDALEMLARVQLQLGDGEGAAASLERLEKAGRAPADLVAMHAEAQLLRGQYDRALEIARGIDSAEGHRIAALALIGQGKVEEAEAAFQAGMDAPGAKARLLADYAIYTLRAGNEARAAQLAGQALEDDADALDPLIASARVAQAGGDLNKALSHYEKAAKLWPESRAAMIGRIGVLGDLGRLEEARPLIEEMARIAPGDVDVAYLQARLAAADAEWSKARDILQGVEGDANPRVQLLYSRALIELDLPQQALPRLAALVRSAPTAPAPRRLLARAQMDTGDAAKAFDTIRPLASSALGTPQDLVLYEEAARASGQVGRIDTALAAAPPERRIAALLARGDAAIARKEWGSAIDAYEQLRGWAGDSNAIVLNNLAYAHSQTGNTAKALETAEKAARIAPDNASVLDTLGWILVQSGEDRARGTQMLERAARMAPSNAAIKRHLAAARKG